MTNKKIIIELEEICKRLQPYLTKVKGRLHKKLSIEKMINLAYKKFYFRPKYILKTLKKIKSIDDIKKYAEGLWFMIGMSS